MRKIELDIRNIQTVGALHVYMQYLLDLPAHYGRNLDALHDALTQENEKRHIVLLGPAWSGGEIEAYLPRLIRVFEDCAQENDRIAFDVKSI